MFIIYSGIDKSGKSTLISKFHRMTNFAYSCIDRFSGTSYAYGKLWKRDLDYDSYIFQDLSIMNDAILVYLYAPDDIIAKRFYETNETDITMEQLSELKKYYEEYLAKTPLFTVRINTQNPIEQCVAKIQEAIVNFESEQVEHKIFRLMNTLNYLGSDAMGAKELRDVTIKFNNEDFAHKEIDFGNEWTELEEIYYALANKIRILIEYNDVKQPLESRQFIYHSDSCISLFHVMYRDSALYVYVDIRSLNIIKNLKLDLYGIRYIANRINDRYFKATKIKYSVNIHSLHKYGK